MWLCSPHCAQSPGMGTISTRTRDSSSQPPAKALGWPYPPVGVPGSEGQCSTFPHSWSAEPDATPGPGAGTSLAHCGTPPPPLYPRAPLEQHPRPMVEGMVVVGVVVSWGGAPSETQSAGQGWPCRRGLGWTGVGHRALTPELPPEWQDVDWASLHGRAESTNRELWPNGDPHPIPCCGRVRAGPCPPSRSDLSPV